MVIYLILSKITKKVNIQYNPLSKLTMVNKMLKELIGKNLKTNLDLQHLLNKY